MAPKYPNITAKLTGQDGNAFNLMGIVNRALANGGVPKTERDQFIYEAMNDDYNALLRTCMRWVTVK